MDYYEWNITLSPTDPWSDILIAELGELGFDSFVQTDEGIQAYVAQDKLKDLDGLRDKIEEEFCKRAGDCHIQQVLIPHQNWNAEWEANFDPVYVDNLLVIQAPFHQLENVDPKVLNITIQPQMSFGTGHHQTTWLMSQTIFGLDLVGKQVLDMGSGTGVLAILAEKRGAAAVFGVDIESWAVDNAVDNAELNTCKNCRFVLGDIQDTRDLYFDCILANINMNVLLCHLPSYSLSLKPAGDLLLSGFFETDIPQLLAAAEANGLREEARYTRDEWACLHLKKKK